MRGSTICLIAFSAIMGMASVGLTSAHPHDEDIEVDIELSEPLPDAPADLDALSEAILDDVMVPRPRAEHRSDQSERASRREGRGQRRNKQDRLHDWPYFGDKENSGKASDQTADEAALDEALMDQLQDEGKDVDTAPGDIADQKELGDVLNARPDYAAIGKGTRPLPLAPVVPPIAGSEAALKAQADQASGAVTRLTIPTLTVDDLSTSFEKRMQKHILRFAESLGAAREKNEDRFAYFDDGLTLESPEDMRQAARLAEEVIYESGVISNVADFAADIIEDIKIERTGESFTVDFEGKRLGKLTRSVTAGVEQFNIEGLGSLMTLNRREIIGEDGKPRTRITLDIDDAAR